MNALLHKHVGLGNWIRKLRKAKEERSEGSKDRCLIDLQASNDRGNIIVKRLEMIINHIRRYINRKYYYYFKEERSEGSKGGERRS